MIVCESIEKQMSSSEEVASLINSILAKETNIERDKEHLYVIGLDAQNIVKYVDLVFLGSLTKCETHPREIFRLAILRGCNSIIVAHNHPSGNTRPSKQDHDITLILSSAGELLSIKVLDHVIVGNGYYSFNRTGLYLENSQFLGESLLRNAPIINEILTRLKKVEKRNKAARRKTGGK